MRQQGELALFVAAQSGYLGFNSLDALFIGSILWCDAISQRGMERAADKFRIVLVRFDVMLGELLVQRRSDHRAETSSNLVFSATFGFHQLSNQKIPER